ncbi:putative uncharacterized protein [Waddlia chondrophila 2032/99]|uniref:Soluble ligand binding domain-containing protein n=1 Tax=Waddlia chondrophila 2032/99 TaxID=765953 RepID=F8LA66_9BACT|nr:putative uncharacterized protein [Waddlia chondrophila 2032/99]
MKKPALPFYERLFAIMIVGFFVFIIFLNYWFSERDVIVDKQHPQFIQNPFVEVVVEGKVKKPGTYRVKKGSLVREVVEMAEVEENANLDRIKLDSKLTRRRKINIR